MHSCRAQQPDKPHELVLDQASLDRGLVDLAKDPAAPLTPHTSHLTSAPSNRLAPPFSTGALAGGVRGGGVGGGRPRVRLLGCNGHICNTDRSIHTDLHSSSPEGWYNTLVNDHEWRSKSCVSALRASRILLCTCNRGLRPRQRMYQPSGLGTNRPRRKHHAHIRRITVRHHMPLVSTEDLSEDPSKLRALCASVFQRDCVGNL